MFERSDFEPGLYVRHPRKPEWGLGQVQSAIRERVTVMFEHAGKVVINTDNVSLERMDGSGLDGSGLDGPGPDGSE